jgi:methyltransferase-like protein
VTAHTTASKHYIVDLLASAPRYTLRIENRPQASPLARYQAASTNRVTNLRSETVALGDLDRKVLLLLDGTRRPCEIVDVLIGDVGQGTLHVEEKDQPAPSGDRLRGILNAAIDRTLPKLAGLALLVNPA